MNKYMFMQQYEKFHDEKNIIGVYFGDTAKSVGREINLSLAKSTYKNKSLLQKKIFFYSMN